MGTGSEQQLLQRMFDAAIASADPARVLARHLPDPPRGRIVVVGAGKAAAAMAAAVEAAWPDLPLTGIVVTRYGHTVPTQWIEVVEASHPVPDEAGVAAAGRILNAVQGLTADDLVLALISGGGSSLLTLPAPGLTLQDKIVVNRRLLTSGLPIGEMNRVRRRLSAVKGGRLALAAAPAQVVTLAISDVPGDDPRTIASGPTVPDPDAGDDLSPLLARLGEGLPPEVMRRLQTPDPVQDFSADYRLIATPRAALMAAADVARAAGVMPLILGDAIEGEAAEVARVMSGIALSVRRHGDPVAPPAVLLSGGETTVTLGDGPASGGGGRNSTFALALALALDGAAGVHAIAGDTDGIDGLSDAAGALIGPDTLTRARAAGLDAAAMLARHDTLGFFAGLGDLVKTGPTLTNVNDFRAILVT